MGSRHRKSTITREEKGGGNNHIPGSNHPTCKFTSMTDIPHECHDPSSNAYLDTHVNEEEQSNDPRDASSECFMHGSSRLCVVVVVIAALGVLCAEDGACVRPEGESGGEEFQDADANLFVLESMIMLLVEKLAAGNGARTEMQCRDEENTNLPSCSKNTTTPTLPL